MSLNRRSSETIESKERLVLTFWCEKIEGWQSYWTCKRRQEVFQNGYCSSDCKQAKKFGIAIRKTVPRKFKLKRRI